MIGMQYIIQPIATGSNSRKMIKDDHWGEITSTIELSENLHEAPLKGIGDFSHLEIIFILIRLQTIKSSKEQIFMLYCQSFRNQILRGPLHNRMVCTQ